MSIHTIQATKNHITIGCEMRKTKCFQLFMFGLISLKFQTFNNVRNFKHYWGFCLQYKQGLVVCIRHCMSIQCHKLLLGRFRVKFGLVLFLFVCCNWLAGTKPNLFHYFQQPKTKPSLITDYA